MFRVLVLAENILRRCQHHAEREIVAQPEDPKHNTWHKSTCVQCTSERTHQNEIIFRTSVRVVDCLWSKVIATLKTWLLDIKGKVQILGSDEAYET